jgi:hypothetical protein
MDMHRNGKIEQYIHTIEDSIQTLLADSKLPLSFWGDVALMFIYLYNRLPTSTLPEDETPHKAMNHSKPDLSHHFRYGGVNASLSFYLSYILRVVQDDSKLSLSVMGKAE